MRCNRLFTLTVLAGALALLAQALVSSAEEKRNSVGKKIASFALTDARDQKRVALADFKDKKAVVVFFLGTECPVNNAYMPRLTELHKAFAARGVQFLAVNSNEQDTADRVAAHAKKNEIPFPVLKDDGQKVADLFGAVRTPEVFVLGGDSKIAYQGRIDDQFGVGYQKPQATERDLAQALEEILSGKAVTKAVTEASGCKIGRPTSPKATASVTYARDVSRIMQNNCQECHRQGQIGPMALLTYKDAANWSDTIREVVDSQRMPPWHADARFGKFANDRSLSKEDKDKLLAWIDQGCPKGDDKDLPAPKQFSTESWRIGKPDLILSMAEEFDVPAETPKGGVPYKYFTVETNFKEDMWVSRAEARGGAAAVVHHIIVFIQPPDGQFQPDRAGRVLCGTAPGDMPMICPDGMAKKVPKGSKLIFQMHYTPNGIAQKDRSSVGLVFSKPPERSVLTMPVANNRFEIPPGDGNYQVESQFAFREDALVLSFMPHMHVRGKDFLVEAIFPDGKKETLLSVPHFDFGWQSVYRCAKPLAMPKGTKIHCIAHFDNSTANANNPDPTKAVRWGDQTWEEMMIGWTDFVYDKKAE